MSAEWPPELPERTPAPGLGALLILLLLILFAVSARRAAGGIRLATPVFVTLTPDAASQVASELGAVMGELLEDFR